MKKTLIALAVLAASGAAMAQSSVTIYGVLDVGVGKVKGGKWGINNGEGYSTPASGSINPAAKDGFNSTTVLGFRGTEDLGGGLKANFNLQTGGFDLSTGGTALAFSREAWVGLESSVAGAIQFGRSSSLGAKVMGAYDFNGTSYSSAHDRAGISAVTWYGSSRRSDQIQYASPNFAGLTVRAAVTPRGDATPNGIAVPGGNAASPVDAKNRYSLGATYANGPLSVSGIGETKQARNAGLRTAYAFGVSYDLSVVKLGATYNRRERDGDLTKNFNTFGAGGGQNAGGAGWTVSVTAPIGAANVGIQYARNTEAEIKALELYANYALSKRTRVYTDFVKGYSQNASAAVAATATAGGQNAIPAKPWAIGVGVVHTF
jgi:predicted porin